MDWNTGVLPIPECRISELAESRNKVSAMLMLIDLLLASLHSCVFFPDKKLQHEGKILNRTNFEKADS